MYKRGGPRPYPAFVLFCLNRGSPCRCCRSGTSFGERRAKFGVDEEAHADDATMERGQW